MLGGLEHVYLSIYWEEESQLTKSYFSVLKPPTSYHFGLDGMMSDGDHVLFGLGLKEHNELSLETFLGVGNGIIRMFCGCHCLNIFFGGCECMITHLKSSRILFEI